MKLEQHSTLCFAPMKRAIYLNRFYNGRKSLEAWNPKPFRCVFIIFLFFKFWKFAKIMVLVWISWSSNCQQALLASTKLFVLNLTPFCNSATIWYRGNCGLFGDFLSNLLFSRLNPSFPIQDGSKLCFHFSAFSEKLSAPDLVEL